MSTSNRINCGMCHGTHASVDEARRYHSVTKPPSHDDRETATSASLPPKKLGDPIFGDKLVDITFTGNDACDLCGKELLGRSAIFRPDNSGNGMGGWCKECAIAYDFDGLIPSVAASRDTDTIQTVYHFTDSQNLASIHAHGVLNLDALTLRGIQSHMSSTDRSREIDRRDGLSGLVRLTLHPHHPMAWKALFDYRSDEIAWLKIDRSVLEDPLTRYSNTNALTAGRTVGNNHLLATRGTDQAEAMVPYIPTAAIIDVVNTISL